MRRSVEVISALRTWPVLLVAGAVALFCLATLAATGGVPAIGAILALSSALAGFAAGNLAVLSDATPATRAAAAASTRLNATREAQLTALVVHSGDAIMNYALDGTILSWNPAAERLFGWSAAEAIGQHARLLAPVERIAEQADILRRIAEGHTFSFESVRLAKDRQAIDVSIAKAPVKDAKGDILSVSAVLRDIRDRVRSGQQLEIARKEAERRAREAEQSKQLLETLLANVPAGITIAGGPPDFPIIAQSEHGIAVMQGSKLGWAQPGPSPTLKYLKMDARTPYADEELPLYRATRLGKATHSFATIIERIDGSRITALYDAAPLIDASGGIAGAVSCSLDITERQRSEDQRAFLIRELTHRTKNLLAVILAMLRQSIRSGGTLADFEQKFTTRLQGLAKSHDMLVAQNFEGASIRDLVRSQLGHFAEFIGGRIALSGADVSLKAEAAQNIGLALHELSTNAAKYGALSQDGGRVAIEWSLDGDDAAKRMFRIAWLEQGGPGVQPPTRRGFGQIVMERLVAQSLDGDVALDFYESGVSWRLAIPAKFVTASSPGAGGGEPA